MKVSIYLADQNPHRDRSLGISKMTTCLLERLSQNPGLEIETLASRSSIRASTLARETVLPWRTDFSIPRLLTDHFHALVGRETDINFYPKGYLGFICPAFGKRVVTIHDTIIQHYADYYPEERSGPVYRYWVELTKHSLRHADLVLTVSKAAKTQILEFCARHQLPTPEVMVTYEASAYEDLSDQETVAKEPYVLHLASKAPHKRTKATMQLWERMGDQLPELRLVGPIPDDAKPILAKAKNIVQLPFLAEQEFIRTIRAAKALVFPSEIEGFGLPAIEAYFLGTPVCVGLRSAMDEVLTPATRRGRFDLREEETLATALDDVLEMTPPEIREIGSKLRESYSTEKFADAVTSGFELALAR